VYFSGFVVWIRSGLAEAPPWAWKYIRNQYGIADDQKQSAVHCRERRRRSLNLARIFGVGLAHGHIWILGRIRRFLDGKRLRVCGHTKSVLEGIIHIGIQMPEPADWKPSAGRCHATVAGLQVPVRQTNKAGARARPELLLFR
jgi:hypothetical protein